MALIRCPECGKEISDKAVHCIGCGFPIQSHIQSSLTIKAETYPYSNEFRSFPIEIIDHNNDIIAEVETGAGVTVTVKREMEIRARFKRSVMKNKSTSNAIKVFPGESTKIQITYRREFMFITLHMYKVDIIDSE